MVTKLKNNLSYIKYIRKEMKKNFPEWEEYGETDYEGQTNNNFGISFKKDLDKIQLIKDREQLELRIYKENNPIGFGYLIYNLILEHIREQDPPLGVVSDYVGRKASVHACNRAEFRK